MRKRTREEEAADRQQLERRSKLSRKCVEIQSVTMSVCEQPDDADFGRLVFQGWNMQMAKDWHLGIRFVDTFTWQWSRKPFRLTIAKCPQEFSRLVVVDVTDATSSSSRFQNRQFAEAGGVYATIAPSRWSRIEQFDIIRSNLNKKDEFGRSRIAVETLGRFTGSAIRAAFAGARSRTIYRTLDAFSIGAAEDVVKMIVTYDGL